MYNRQQTCRLASFLRLLGKQDTAEDEPYTNTRICTHLLLGSSLGIPTGFISVSILPEELILYLLGGLTIAVGLFNAATPSLEDKQVPENSNPITTTNNLLTGSISLASRVVHGAFASRSTFILTYAQRILPNQDTFRGSLSVYWSSLNLGFLAYLLSIFQS